MIGQIFLPKPTITGAVPASGTITVMSPEQFTQWIALGPLPWIALTEHETSSLTRYLQDIDPSITKGVGIHTVQRGDSHRFLLGSKFLARLTSPDFANQATADDRRTELGRLVDYVISLQTTRFTQNPADLLHRVVQGLKDAKAAGPIRKGIDVIDTDGKVVSD